MREETNLSEQALISGKKEKLGKGVERSYRLVALDPVLLDIPKTELAAQPPPACRTMTQDEIDMVLLTRPPVVKAVQNGRYEVLANASVALWFRMQPCVMPRARRIRCIVVTLVDNDGARWKLVDKLMVDEMLGRNSKRRSMAVRRAVRGTKLAGKPIAQAVRDELAVLLEKSK